MTRPTIRQLEDILSDPNPGRVEIAPDGSIHVIAPLTERIADAGIKLAEYIKAHAIEETLSTHVEIEIAEQDARMLLNMAESLLALRLSKAGGE